MIVIDDVWDPEALRPLMVDGPQSRALITGRERQVLDQAGVLAERIAVPAMTGDRMFVACRKTSRIVGTRQIKGD